MREIASDICIIGAGSGGLSVAAAAAQLGARTVLIEAHAMGGDCLNTGCVPSKALLAAAHRAQAFRDGAAFGIAAVEPTIDFAKVNAHVHDVIAGIAPHDSEERFTKLGCTVIRARARFTGPRTVEAGDARVNAKYFVVATGSRAAVPPIPGLAETPYFTNETIFANTTRPDHLIIIGAGPIGCEMAQAHRRLGSRVTVLDKATLLPKDDPELAGIVKQRLVAEGIDIFLNIQVARIDKTAGGVAVTVEYDGAKRVIAGSHLLIATGRRANVEDLGLDAAGIATTKTGIQVDDRLRTSNPRVFAIGDVAGAYQFTHLANYHAGIVIRNVFFWQRTRVDHSSLPWVTFTDPELAQVGLTEAEAAKAGPVQVLRATYLENDRARAERATEGVIKVIVDRRGRVLGTGIAGRNAGELIQPWVLAIKAGLKIKTLATMIAPYPTLGEVNKRAAGAYFTPLLFSERTRRLVRFLLRWS